jgi:hypothetical protein
MLSNLQAVGGRESLWEPRALLSISHVHRGSLAISMPPPLSKINGLLPITLEIEHLLVSSGEKLQNMENS